MPEEQIHKKIAADRDLDAELNKLLSEINSKVPDLPGTTVGQSGTGKTSAPPAAKLEAAKPAPAAPAMPLSDGAPISDNMTITDDSAEAILRNLGLSDDAKPAFAAHQPISDGTPLPADAMPAIPGNLPITDDMAVPGSASSERGKSTNDPVGAALADQIQSLLEDSRRQDQQKPAAAQPAPPADDMDLTASLEALLAQASGPATAAAPAPPASPPPVNAPAEPPPADMPAARNLALKDIDDHLSQQADESIAGVFETVQDVLQANQDAPSAQESAELPVDPQSILAQATQIPLPTETAGVVGQASAADVARELDSQPENSSPGINASTAAPPVADAPKAVADKDKRSAQPAAAPATSHNPASDASPPAAAPARFKLRLPSPLAPVRLLLTMMNAPLLRVSAPVRNAVGVVGLGSIAIGGAFIALVILRH